MLSDGIVKTAVIGALASGLSRAALGVGRGALAVAKPVGKGVIWAGGGKLNTALTAMDAANQYQGNMEKLKASSILR